MKKTLLLFLLPCILQAQTPRLVVPVGHTAFVSSVAFSPDGKQVLTGSGDKIAILWDLSGRELQSFMGHISGISSVAFSPDGQRVLTGSDDKTAILWDLKGNKLQSFIGHIDGISSVAFSPDGQRVLTGSYDKTAIIWDLKGNKVQSFVGHTDWVCSVAFSPDGQRVLTGSYDGTAKLWSLKGRRLKSLRHTNVVSSVAFSPDGQLILTGCFDGTAKLWNLKGKQLLSFVNHHVRGVNSVAFSPDGQYVLTGSFDQTAKLWDITGKVLGSFVRDSAILSRTDYYGEKALPSYSVNAVAFSPDGNRVLTGNTDETAILWDFSGKELQSFSGHTDAISSVAFSPDGQRVLAGSYYESHVFSSGASYKESEKKLVRKANWDNVAKLWDLKDRTLQPFVGPAVFNTCAAFSPDGQRILTGGSWDQSAKLWNLNGREVQAFVGHDEIVRSVTYSPDGEHVLTGSWGRTAKLWDLTGKELKSFVGGGNIPPIAFSPDGKSIFIGDWGYAKLWDLTGKELTPYFGGRISSVVYSPDGQCVLTGGGDGTVKLWNLKGKELKSFVAHADSLSSVAFSPDGQSVLTGSRDNTAKLWDLTGKALKTFVGHVSALSSVAFSPDGQRVLTGSLDNTVKLWDTQSGKLLATLIAIDSNDWVVTTPSGLFDASDGAKKRMYYVVAYEKEKIVLDLEQIQQRYWQPGLLGAIMGLTPYPVRDLGVFDNLRLFPSIEDSTRIESERLYVKLRERNGGLGKLSLIINGIVREENVNPERKKDLNIDLKRYYRFLRTDTLNTIELEVYESGNELKSEPYKLYYQASLQKRGEGNEEAPRTNDCQRPPHLYLIVVGTSLYPQGVDSLPSANEDALEMARVLQEAGKQLYDDRVHLKLLATRGGEPPSKANIAAAFDAFKTAGVCDVLVVFFAGHGSNWGKDGDKPNFYYLTKDMTFGNLNDEGIRKAYAISDKELKDWMREIPAEYKLTILDACNSGLAAVNMGGVISRDLDPDQIIAFNEMSGNSGSYVISGSSESGASFESSVLGHGLLTYSLLEGIKATAREGTLVDVLPLLLKSYKRVGELAKSLGKEQTPIIAKPRGNASFYAGKNDGTIKIDLPETKPMVIRSVFMDQDSYVDHLHIAEELNRLFRSKLIKGEQAPWFYSDSSEHPQGFSIRGTYAVQPGNKVIVCGSLVRGEMPVGEPFTINGENSAKVLADLIYKAVKPGIKLK